MSLQSSGSSADRIQSGTEAQRPSTVEAGQIRFNTGASDFEVYDGSRWVMMRPPVSQPISDTNRTLGLSMARGLELTPEGNLEAAVGRGIYFDSSGKLTTSNTISPNNGDPAIFFNPKIVVDRRSDNISFNNGGSGPQTFTNESGLDINGTDSTDPGKITPRIIEIKIPNECNRIIIETRSRYSSAPNPNVVYGDGTPGANGTGQSSAEMGFMLVDPPDSAQVLSGSAASRNQALNSIGGSQVSINGSNGQGDSTFKNIYSQNRHDVISINPLPNPGSRILRIKSVITRLTCTSMLLNFQQPRFYIQPMFISDPETIFYDFV